MTEAHTQAHLTLIERLLRNKRWIFISMLVFVAGAFIYLAFSPDRVRVTIKAAICGNNETTESIIDEIKSKPLFQRTIDRLPLQVNYYHKGIFSNTEISPDSLPVRLAFNKSTAVDSPGELTFMPVDDQIYEIRQQDTIIQYHYNEPVKYAFVSFKAAKGPAFALHAEPVLLKFNEPDELTEQYFQNFKARYSGDDKTLELSIIATSPQKGRAFLNKLVELYNSTQPTNGTEVSIANESVNTEIKTKLEKLKSQVAALQLKADNLKRQKNELAVDQPQITAKPLDQEQRNLQLKTLEVIRPYAQHPIAQFVQIPYGDEVNDKDLRGMISRFNKIQLDKQHELQDSQANRYRINGFNNQIAGLKTNITQKIDEVSGEMKGKSTAATSNLVVNKKALDNSLLNINKQLKALQSEYTRMVQNSKVDNSNSDKVIAVNTPKLTIISKAGSEITTYPSAIMVYLLAALMGLVFAIAILLLGYIEIPANNLADLRKLQARIYEMMHAKEID